MEILKTPTGRDSKAKTQADYNTQKRTRYAENPEVKETSRKRCLERYHRTKILKKSVLTTTEDFDDKKI